MMKHYFFVITPKQLQLMVVIDQNSCFLTNYCYYDRFLHKGISTAVIKCTYQC